MKKILKATVCVLFCLVLCIESIDAQVTKADYDRADSIKNFSRLIYNCYVSPIWVDSSSNCFYEVKTRRGTEYFLVDANKAIKKIAFDQEKLCANLNKLLNKKNKPYSLPLENIEFKHNLKSFNFCIDTIKYKCELPKYTVLVIGKKEKTSPEEYWGNSFNELGNKPVISPDSTSIVYVKNFNVFIQDRKTKKEFQLSFDGSEGDLYSSYLSWSPDSKHIITTKVRMAPKRYMYFVESSPSNQFLPKLNEHEYLRAGDALPIKRPALFDVKFLKQIPLETEPFENQFALENLKWNKNSQSFTFEFNQRGHQVYQVVKVDANTGEMKIIIDEQSNTFIDYSGKHYRYDTDKNQIIWASERDGWNHLYLIDGNTGKIIKQITKGNWLVRGVEYIDEEAGEIIFRAGGMNSDEDPYFIHYYRIRFDGTGLIELTPEKRCHSATFSKDYAYFIDNYSAANVVPATVLRDSKTGKVILDLEKGDINDIIALGYKMPEPFVAKARDGKTDIWGNIYRPTNFDSTKTYPVIEYIYAGPQSSFVQKTFRPHTYAYSGLAELGFIMVQIDGMGTSNRSKAFHDVCYKNLKDAGFEDRILWIKAAAKKYNYMDTSRVGVFGGSAGGQNSTAALLFHPEFYKVGVSSCGCHDNRLDKMWWNEQWMGFPIGPQYSSCSNIDNASKLQGKLMLIVGEMDDNVDPSSTYRLADALIKANKDFDLVMIPGANHTSGGDFGEHKRRDFFVKNLLGYDPPTWKTYSILHSKN